MDKFGRVAVVGCAMVGAMYIGSWVGKGLGSVVVKTIKKAGSKKD